METEATTVKTTIYLTPSQHEWLRRKAFEERTTIAELIREAIDNVRGVPRGEKAAA